MTGCEYSGTSSFDQVPRPELGLYMFLIKLWKNAVLLFKLIIFAGSNQ